MGRVLLAESDHRLCLAMRLFLEQDASLGVVGEADHAESLLAQACLHPPDLVLMDWNLKGLRPIQLLEALRECCPAASVVVTSVSAENRDQALASGADAFLLKNLPPDEFLASLHTILTERDRQ